MQYRHITHHTTTPAHRHTPPHHTSHSISHTSHHTTQRTTHDSTMPHHHHTPHHTTTQIVHYSQRMPPCQRKYLPVVCGVRCVLVWCRICLVAEWCWCYVVVCGCVRVWMCVVLKLGFFFAYFRLRANSYLLQMQQQPRILSATSSPAG